MDRVLEGLADEPERQAPVIDLAKRRRRVASFLVAAAAVVVVGVGIGQVVETSGGDGESLSSDDSGGVAADSGTLQEEEQAPAEAAPSAATKDDAAGSRLTVRPRDLYTLNPEELSADVEQLRKSRSYQRQDGSFDVGAQAFTVGATTCRTVDWGRGVLIPVQYGEDLGGLVFREPLGDTQVADVYLCGDRTPVRSLTLPVP
jgi:hypothetical protein